MAQYGNKLLKNVLVNSREVHLAILTWTSRPIFDPYSWQECDFCNLGRDHFALFRECLPALAEATYLVVDLEYFSKVSKTVVWRSKFRRKLTYANFYQRRRAAQSRRPGENSQKSFGFFFFVRRLSRLTRESTTSKDCSKFTYERTKVNLRAS